jgi:hypothetical protein
VPNLSRLSLWGAAAGGFGYLFDVDLKLVIATARIADQFFTNSLRVLMAIVGSGRSLFTRVFKLFAVLFQQPVDIFVAPLVVATGMNHNRPVGLAVQFDDMSYAR